MFRYCAFTHLCRLFEDTKSDSAHFLYKAAKGDLAEILREKSLLRGQSSDNKIVITFSEVEGATNTRILYCAKNKGERTISVDKFESLPEKAVSLVINIENDDVDFSSVDASIREYIRNKTLQWTEIHFRKLTSNLYAWLGEVFVGCQSSYLSDHFPQSLYVSKYEEKDGSLDIYIIEATISTTNDINKFAEFLKQNKENTYRIGIKNVGEAALGLEVLKLLQREYKGQSNAFFQIINCSENNTEINFTLYDVRNQKILTSDYQIIEMLLNSQWMNTILLNKLEIFLNIQTSISDLTEFMARRKGFVGLFHIYMGDVNQFLNLGLQIFLVDDVDVIIEHNTSHGLDSPYCRAFQAKKEYMAIEFRGKYDWYKVVRTDLANYRFLIGESEFYGKADEWAMRIMECTAAQTLLINDETSVLPNALIQQVESKCDLDNLFSIEMHIPNIGNLGKLENCRGVKEVIFNFYKKKSGLLCMLEKPILMIQFPKWSIRDKLDIDDSIVGVTILKTDDKLKSKNFLKKI